MKLYKITDEDDGTHRMPIRMNTFPYQNWIIPKITQWGEGVTYSVNDGDGSSKYRPEKAYTNPLLAVFLTPMYEDLEEFHLWEAEGEIHNTNCGLIAETYELTTIRRISAPIVSLVQRMAFGILCAKQVCVNQTWLVWADKWLSGKDRSKEAMEKSKFKDEEVTTFADSSAREAMFATTDMASENDLVPIGSAKAAMAAAYANRNSKNLDKQYTFNLVTLAEKAMEY
jgi:hypothetical protein